MPFELLVDAMAHAAHYEVPPNRYLWYGDEVMGDRVFRFDPGWFGLGPDTTSVRHQDLPFRLDPVETVEHSSSAGSSRSSTESEMAEDLGNPVIRVVIRAGGESEVGTVVDLEDDSEGSSDLSVVGEAAGVMLTLSEGDFLRETRSQKGWMASIPCYQKGRQWCLSKQ